MKLIIFALIVVLGIEVLICDAFFSQFPAKEFDVKKTVEFINRLPSLSWKAGPNGFKEKLKLSDIKSKLGWVPHKRKPTTSRSSGSAYEKDNLPLHFDARTKYPNCTTISSIKDQSNCGSCWAVSTAAVFSDRLCIHSHGKINFNMSADQLLACDKTSKGCDGGYLDSAWKYIETSGLVTGGDYGTNDGCAPYSIKPKSGLFAPKPKTPECLNISCPDRYSAKNVTEFSSDEHALRNEIYKNGPLTTGFITYLSFMFYDSGVYEKLWLDIPLGGHAVRVIGWGEENGIKYWLVANSWGKDWGEDGLFRIKRGDNNCDFEANMIAGLPKI